MSLSEFERICDRYQELAHNSLAHSFSVEVAECVKGMEDDAEQFRAAVAELLQYVIQEPTNTVEGISARVEHFIEEYQL